MPARDPSVLRLSVRHLEMVRVLLRQYLPDAEVWAYGSRVTGGGHEASDLDLVGRNPSDTEMEIGGLSRLRDAFVESNLPIRVEILDWSRIPMSFQREIEKEYVVLH